MRKNLVILMAMFMGVAANAQVMDIDGKTYKTIKMDIETWMAENLNVSRFRNGDVIAEAKSADDWIKAGNEKKAAWCYYNNNPANGKKYGKLYNWFAVNDPRGLAPEGWHVAGSGAWKKLYAQFPGYDSRKSLKSKEGWGSSLDEIERKIIKLDHNGTNKSGFSALPAGCRKYGDFTLGGNAGITKWWSCTQYDQDEADYAGINASSQLLFDGGEDYFYNTYKATGLSVRCIKNADQDIYPAVTIGNQQWMKANLAVSKFSNGTIIKEATSIKEWKEANEAQLPAWCYYEFDEANNGQYGKLYNWHAVNDNNGLAPAGWHIPTDGEWAMLSGHFGDSIAGLSLQDTNLIDHIKKQIKINGKITETQYQEKEQGFIQHYNESGFAAMMGGCLFDNDKFSGLHSTGYWWSTSKRTTTRTTTSYIGRRLCSYCKKINWDYFSINTGLSVRCVKD